MKAAMWYGRQDVRVGRVDDPPDPPPGQLQVEVAWCGICGTDASLSRSWSTRAITASCMRRKAT
jgi:threonine dehydrogenase-like Zn-dependent dehydrogenase